MMNEMRKMIIRQIQKTLCVLLCVVMLVSTIAPATYAVDADDLIGNKYIESQVSIGEDTTPTGDDALTGEDTPTGDDALVGDNPLTGDDALTGEETLTGDDTLIGDEACTGNEEFGEEDDATELLPQMMPPMLDPPAGPVMPEKTYQWYADGYEAGSFSISTAGELRELAALVNGTAFDETDTTVTDDFEGKTVTLATTIDISDAAWTPIGTEEKPFKGVLDGNGNTISGLTIGSASAPVTAENQGLFGYLTDTVKNLTVTGGVYSSGKNVGGIAGYCAGQILDCTFGTDEPTDTEEPAGTEKSVVSGGSNVGGIAGGASGSTLTACVNKGTVNGTATGTGGVVGNMTSAFTVTNCANKGTVVGAASTGGVIGLTGNATADVVSTVTGCYNGETGKVSGAEGTGGVIGKTGNYHDFEECNNLGSVEGADYTGGVLGQSGTCTKLTNCYSTGSIQCTGTNAGGVVGSLGANSWLSGCYNAADGEVTGTGTNTGGVAGSTSGMSAAVNGLYNAGTVTGSGTNTGGVIGNLGVPGYSITELYNTGTVTGSGTNTGGVFGQVAAGCNDSIMYCYNTGTVSSSGKYVGGVTGLLSGSYNYMSGAKDSRIHFCWNLGGVTGTDASTVAGGICGMSTQNYAYVLDCFNVGTITTQEENYAAAISGDGFSMNQNCYYLDSSIQQAPREPQEGTPLDGTLPEDETEEILPTARDSQYATAKSQKAFAAGEVAYLMDKGGTVGRTELWGQGSQYPVPADAEHPAVYRLTFSVSGPADGFTVAPLPEDAPEGTPEPPANGLKLGDELLDAENRITAYGVKGQQFETVYTLKDGYQIDRIVTSPSTNQAVLNQAAQTLSFTMPDRTDASVEMVFASKPSDSTRTYTVTFDANGGKWLGAEATEEIVLKTSAVTAGQMVSEPEAPTRDGGLLERVDFTGWYTDQACTEAYNFTTAVRGDLTLYAGWHITKQYTVTFHAGEGTFGTVNTRVSIVAEGESTDRPQTPVRDKFNFHGWYTDEECKLAYDFSSKVTAPITLYAGWVAEGQCTVIFNANGGVNDEGDSVWSITLDRDTVLEEPSGVTKTPSGSTTFLLDSWMTAGSNWNFSNSVTESMTLTAHWTANPLSEPNAEGFYEIPDLEALETLRNEMGKNQNFAKDKTFVLTGDIALPADWTAIGEYMKKTTSLRQTGFSGIFDGQGHTITLHNQQQEPLFGATSGVIKNLNIKGDSCTDVPVGIAYSTKNGTFENCTVEAKLYDAYAGILYYAYSGSTITNCTVKSGSVIVNNNAAAGIVAITTSSGTHCITNCIVEDGVSITGTGDAGSTNGYIGGVGGILADGAAEITQCYSGANLTATAANAYLGGIAGHGNSMGGTQISSCGAAGIFTVRASGIAGGIMGAGYGGGGEGTRQIDNSWFCGTINGTATKIGGFIGDTVDVDALDGYYCIKNDVASTVENNGAVVLSASEFASGKAAWLLDTDTGSVRGIWTQDAANGHPTLGRPTYYPVSISAENGTISIGGKTTEIYLGAGNSVSVMATPNDYDNDQYGPQYAYVLTKLTVNDEACDGKSFTMPEDGTTVAVVFARQQVGYNSYPSSNDKDTAPVTPGETGDGDGAGTGSGNDGSGAGIGENAGNGQSGGVTDSAGTGTTGSPSSQPAQNALVQAVTNGGQTEQNESVQPVVIKPLEAEPENQEDTETPETPETPEEPEKDDNLLKEKPEIEETTKRSVLPVVLLIVAVAGTALFLLLSILRKKKQNEGKRS